MEDFHAAQLEILQNEIATLHSLMNEVSAMRGKSCELALSMAGLYMPELMLQGTDAKEVAKEAEALNKTLLTGAQELDSTVVIKTEFLDVDDTPTGSLDNSVISSDENTSIPI